MALFSAGLAPGKISHRTHLLVDASTADNPADFYVNFQNSHNSHGLIRGIVPIDVAVQNSFPNVKSANRRIVFDFSGAIYVVDLPIGYYSTEQYWDEVAAQLVGMGSPVTIVSADIHPVTSKVTLTMTGPWIYRDDLSSCSVLVGADGNLTHVANVATFPTQTNMVGDNILLVESEVIPTNATLVGGRQISLIDTIDLTGTAGGKVCFSRAQTDHLRTIVFDQNVNLQELHIRITTTSGQPLVLPPGSVVFINLLVLHGLP